MAFTLATNLLLYVIAVGAPGAVSGKIVGSGLGGLNTTAISKSISLLANSTCTSIDPLAPSPSCPILVGPVPANTSLCHQCPTSFEAVQSCPYSCQLLPVEAGVSSGPFCSMTNVTGQILESGFGPARCQRCLPPCDKSTTSVISGRNSTAISTSSAANNASVSTSAASRDSTFTSKTDKLSTSTSTADKDSMLASTPDKDPTTSFAADKDPMSTSTTGKDSTSTSKADNDSTSTSTGDRHLKSTSTDKVTASSTPADGTPMSTSATNNGMSWTTTANKESPPSSINGKDSTSTSSISMQTIESTSTSNPGTSITASPACTTRQAAWPFQGQPKARQRGWGFWHRLGRRHKSHESYGASGCEPRETSTWPKT